MGLLTRKLGRTNLEVTALGMGGAGIGRSNVTDAEAISAIHKAIDLGINYLDTAPLYGESERRVGLALQGGKRHQLHLATKTGTHPKWKGDYSSQGTRRSVENSLKLLKTDYLDICLVHDPDDMGTVVSKEGAFDELKRMREEGLIRYIGLGVREHQFHRLAIQRNDVDVILTYLDYTLIQQTATSLIKVATEKNVGVINGSPIAMGLLSGIKPSRTNTLTDHIKQSENEKAFQLWRLAVDLGVKLLDVAIQFSVRQPMIGCTLTGAKNATEVEQNYKSAITNLSDSVWQKFSDLIYTQPSN